MDSFTRINNVPTSTIVAALDALRALDLSTIPIPTLRQQIEDLFLQGIPRQGVTMAPESFFRARLNLAGGQYFTNAKCLWAPPPEEVTKQGRCNDVGEAILYVSFSAQSAITEVRPQTGQLVTVMHYTASRDVTALDLGCMERCLGPHDNITDLRQLTYKTMAERLGLTRTGFRNAVVVRNWLVDEFTRIVPEGEEFRYKLPIAITRYLFAVAKVDALLYPSIERVFHGVNAVLPIGRAQDLFHPKECFVVRAPDLEKDFATVDAPVQHIGTIDSGSGMINYSPPS